VQWLRNVLFDLCDSTTGEGVQAINSKVKGNWQELAVQRKKERNKERKNEKGNK
jgi:hypothetical protein